LPFHFFFTKLWEIKNIIDEELMFALADQMPQNNDAQYVRILYLLLYIKIVFNVILLSLQVQTFSKTLMDSADKLLRSGSCFDEIASGYKKHLI
jgi:hypothetical protein